jgi:hypothetical protein
MMLDGKTMRLDAQPGGVVVPLYSNVHEDDPKERTNAARSDEAGVSAPDLPRALVQFIAEHGSAKKILTEHAPTKDGRCPRCPAGASSSGRVKSPCTLFQAALAAEKLGGGR